MYGIAGIIRQPHSRLPNLAARLAAMTAAMAHQEPDDKGIYLTPGGQVGLASRQLAIGDLTLTGHIPMHTEDGLVAITYNGEIDNTAALRRELETLGCTFHSHRDTEVILPSYAPWGKPASRSCVAWLPLRFSTNTTGRRKVAGVVTASGHGDGRWWRQALSPSSKYQSCMTRSLRHDPLTADDTPCTANKTGAKGTVNRAMTTLGCVDSFCQIC